VTSRFGSFLEKDAPETPPLSFGSPCQSDIKRTLRRSRSPAWSLICRGFLVPCAAQFEGMVNAKFRDRARYGFEMVHAHRADFESASTEDLRWNPVRGIFRKFSPS
jgi:hypothetical protein